MKLAIIGSRSFNNYELLKSKFYNLFCSIQCDDKLHPNGIQAIISGGAAGADLLGKKLAEELKLKYIEFLPDYNKHGKIAPLIRNEDIIKNSDCVCCFWNGQSKGSANALNWAKKYKKDTIIIYF